MPEEDDPPRPQSQDDETQLMTPPTHGGTILPSSAPQLEVVGDFEILGKLGAGGMGTVYRARQVSLGRMVALKILPHHFMEDTDSVARFQREARVAASLNHGNLVKVYAAGEADGCHYIAMELIEGQDLAQRLKRDGRLPAPEALRVIADVARGLQYGWQNAHLVHRDIKPGNIFLSADGSVKLGDLGLAKSMLGNTTGLTQTGTMMGTPYYLSPEQARGDKEIDFRADIYSLGCTLYHLLTGQVPYTGVEAISIIRQHLDAPLPAILKVWPQCPIPLARLVGKMLKKARHERHANYEELIAQLEAVWAQVDPLSYNPDSFAPPPQPPQAALAATPATNRPASPLRTPPPLGKSKATLYAIAAMVLGIVGGAAFLFLRPKEPLTQAQRLVLQKETDARAAVGTPVAATRDVPFVNSLGMKFVPVPIIGGPTGGQRVLFSIWETRVQDYEAFARETQRAWTRNAASQSPTRPAAEVSWFDAQAFSTWLTERERKTGKIGPHESYRLPTDHEWSCAAGIGDREDPAIPPKEQKTIPNVYPWARGYPPPTGAGNYAGLEEMGTATREEKERTAYRDAFPHSAPVGSFAANAFGIFDLGGNLWEWCTDWAESEQQHRVLRGASFLNLDPKLLLASHRGSSYAPESIGSQMGFRLVLAPDAKGVTTAVKPAAPEHSTANPIAPAPPVITGWQDAMPAVRAEFLKAATGKEQDGWLVASAQTPSFLLDSKSYRDFAVRGRYGGTIQLHLRISPASKYYVLQLTPAGGDLRAPEGGAKLASFTLSRPTEHEFLVTFRRQAISIWIDGAFAGSINDTSLAEGRLRVLLSSDASAVRDLAVADLASDGWTDALAEWWAKPKEPNLLAREAGGAKVLENKPIVVADGAAMDDVAVRTTVRELTNNCALFLRQKSQGDGRQFRYQAALFRDGSTKILLELDHSGVLASAPPPAGFDPAKSHTLEFSALGNQLSLKLDGVETVTASNRTFASGSAGFSAPPGTIIEKLEYQKLTPGATPP